MAQHYATLDSLVEAKLLTREELDALKTSAEENQNDAELYAIPICWIVAAIERASSNGIIHNAYGLKLLLQEINNFRAACLRFLQHDLVTIPLVYTQVNVWRAVKRTTTTTTTNLC